MTITWRALSHVVTVSRIKRYRADTFWRSSSDTDAAASSGSRGKGLRGLIEEDEPRNWSALAHKKGVQGKMYTEVQCHPVLAGADSLQRLSLSICGCRDREPINVQLQLVTAVLNVQRGEHGSHLTIQLFEHGGLPRLPCGGIHKFLFAGNLSLESDNTFPQRFRGIVFSRALQEQRNPTCYVSCLYPEITNLA